MSPRRHVVAMSPPASAATDWPMGANDSSAAVTPSATSTGGDGSDSGSSCASSPQPANVAIKATHVHAAGQRIGPPDPRRARWNLRILPRGAPRGDGPAAGGVSGRSCYRARVSPLRPWIIAATLVTLVGCTDEKIGTTGPWTAGVFEPSATFANQCASPRTGTDPTTGKPYPDVAGSTLTENNFLRSWTNELYLWYREVPDLDPASYATSDYFDLLKTSATTPSGNSKDRFHFTYPTDQWLALSQSGVEAGYGAQFIVIASRPPRQVVVAYTQPNSPATTPPANLARGAKVLTVDGVDLVNASDSASVDTHQRRPLPVCGRRLPHFLDPRPRGEPRPAPSRWSPPT